MLMINDNDPTRHLIYPSKVTTEKTNLTIH